MTLTEVTTSRHIKDFLAMPVALYKKEKNWIRPLDQDIEAVFDPEKNRAFKSGNCIRWILYDNNRQPVGRVAAFVNKKTLNDKHQKIKVGGMGFFECVNDQSVANKLFDACKDWLQKQDVQAIDGPINFGERDRWWGLLISGFTEPNYRMFYHLPYYKELFENYGFQIYFRQYTYSRDPNKLPSESVRAKYDRITANPDYKIVHMRKNNLKKFGEDFAEIYNKAWVAIGTPKLHPAQAYGFMKQIKPLIDEDIVFFAYYKDKPAGFFIMIREMNQFVKHLDGKFGLLEKARLFWMLKTGQCRKMFGVAFGVVPEQQGKGIDGAMVHTSYLRLQEINRYDSFEMNWIGDFNPKMMHVAKNVDGEISKVHVTYRLILDGSVAFERCPMI